MAAEDPISAALADPLGTIVRVIAELEPSLDTTVVAQVIAQVAAGRHKRRRLALALIADPTVLTDGRSTSPLVVQQLIWALKKRGARRVALGCCAVCGRPARLPYTRGAERVCSSCWRNSHRTRCARCGNNRQVSFRDRDGKPRCRGCPPEEATNPTGRLLAIIAPVEPALPTSVVTAAIERALPFMRLRHRAVQILADSPELLRGHQQPHPRRAPPVNRGAAGSWCDQHYPSGLPALRSHGAPARGPSGHADLPPLRRPGTRRAVRKVRCGTCP
jgi:hypothetical protein